MEEFGSQTIEFDFSPAYLEPDAVEDMAWVGFVLRADNLNAVWNDTNRGYLIVIKSDVIEVQRWVNGAPEQLNMEIANDGIIEMGKTYHIKLCSVLTEDKVTIQMYVDDELVVNETDASEGRIQQKGKFLVNGLSRFEGVLSNFAVSGSDDPVITQPTSSTESTQPTSPVTNATREETDTTAGTTPSDGDGDDSIPDTGESTTLPLLLLGLMGVSVFTLAMLYKRKEKA